MMTKQVSYQTVNEKRFLFIRNTDVHQGCIQSNKKFNLYNPLNFFKKIHSSDLQNPQHMVRFCLSEFFERQLGLENPIYSGKYCTVSDISISKCLNLTALTLYLIIAILRCYDWVGAEISHSLANTVRRLCICGFLTTRSPKQTMAKVLL